MEPPKVESLWNLQQSRAYGTSKSREPVEPPKVESLWNLQKSRAYGTSKKSRAYGTSETQRARFGSHLLGFLCANAFTPPYAPIRGHSRVGRISELLCALCCRSGQHWKASRSRGPRETKENDNNQRTCAHTFMRIYIYVHMFVFTSSQAYAHARTYMCIHTYIHV